MDSRGASLGYGRSLSSQNSAFPTEPYLVVRNSRLLQFEGNFETEEDMPNNKGRTKRSEKGLLTPDNCVVALIDHQPQMLFGVSNFDRQSIINNTVALAKAARVFSSPSCPQHGGEQEFQRKSLAANQGCLSGPGPCRAYFDGCLG